MRKRIVSKKILASLFAVALLSAGCGGGAPAQKKVTLKFWKTFEDSQNIRPLINEFRKKYPHVTIEYTKKNVENYEADLLNALASGQGPDIFSIPNASLPEYLDKIIPAPVGSWPYVDYKNSFVDTVVSDFTKNQQI